MDERQVRAAQAALDERAALERQRERLIPARAMAAVRLGEIQGSVALAGVAASEEEIRMVVERHFSLAARPLRDTLVIAGYAAAARWIANVGGHVRAGGIRPADVLAEMRRLHALAIAPEAALEPLEGKPVGTPGGWRTGPAAAYADGAVPLPPWSIPAAMESLASRIAAGPRADMPACLWIARAHAALLRIRPFTRGNGRTARLLANLLLARRALPPWTIDPRRRMQYGDALRLADAGDHASLAVELAHGVSANLDRLLAATDGADALAPLQVLVDSADLARMRKAVQRGRLRHVRRGAAILTTRAWLAEYDALRSPQGRKVTRSPRP